jgi:hypothetical protein
MIFWFSKVSQANISNCFEVTNNKKEVVFTPPQLDAARIASYV